MSQEKVDRYKQEKVNRKQIMRKQKLMNNMRNVALEEQAVETLLAKAKVTEKPTTFSELMNQTTAA